MFYSQSEFVPAIFAMDIAATVSSFLFPSFFCYFGTSASEHVSISDVIYDSNWYDQPIEIQKYIGLMIARSQEEVNFSGIGLVTCSLEVFGKVNCVLLSKLH